MREILLIIENLDAVIATMLNDMDEATFSESMSIVSLFKLPMLWAVEVWLDNC